MLYVQTPIRLAALLVSNPPVAPVDANTGNPPKFWRSSATGVAVGIFDNVGQSVDLSNLYSLSLTIQQYSDSLIPLISKTILQADLIPTISQEGWNDGTEAQAVFSLSKAETDIGLNGQESANLWMILTGVYASGEIIVYVAGPCACYNPGTVLPLPPYGYVGLNKQANNAGNTQAVISTLNQTVVVNVTGAARTSDVILPIVGMDEGALLRLVLNLPATANIVLRVKNDSVGGSILSTLTTGSVLNAVFLYYFDADVQSWVPYFYAVPGI